MSNISVIFDNKIYLFTKRKWNLANILEILFVFYTETFDIVKKGIHIKLESFIIIPVQLYADFSFYYKNFLDKKRVLGRNHMNL